MVGRDPDRSAMLRAAAQTWGEEAAETLSELLPPPGEHPATQRDIEGLLAAMNAMDNRLTAEFRSLRESTDAGFAAVDARFDTIGTRFDAMDMRFVAVDARFDTIDTRFDAMDMRFVAVDARFDTIDTRFDALTAQVGGYGHSLDDKLDNVVDRVTASFERRISDAVTAQTRTLVFSQLGALVVIAALAFGLR